MAYLTKEQIESLGFKSIGKDVKISDKASIYNTELIEIGDNSRIDDFCVISGAVKLGRNVHIAPMCLIAGGEKGVFIGDFSSIAYGVNTFSQSDDYSGKAMTNPTVPNKYTRVTKRAVTIGRHVILGTNTIVLPGSKLEDGVSVGAVSLVQGRLSSWTIFSGNPAVKIRERSKDLLLLESEFLKEKR